MLRHREISSEELVHHFADRIDRQQDLNAFITVDIDHALQQARIADKLLAGYFLHPGNADDLRLQDARQFPLALRCYRGSTP